MNLDKWTREDLEMAVELLMESTIWLANNSSGTSVPSWVTAEKPLNLEDVREHYAAMVRERDYENI